MKKKFLAILGTAVLAGTALVSLAACGGQSGGTGGLTGGGIGGEGTSVETGARNAYGIGAVTTAQLLADSLSASANAPLAARRTAEDTQEGAQDSMQGGAQDNTQGGAQGDTQGGAQGDLSGEELAQFDEYFRTLDAFLNEDAFRTTITENTDAAYAFDYRLTVEGEQLDGSRVSHVMYYSEEQVAVRPDDDDDDDDDNDDNETVEAYWLTGVMVMDDVEYVMTGYRSVERETERDETESSEELWIRASDPEDAGNYVQMSLETEEEEEHGENESEKEYVYSVYREGRLTERTSVDFETEAENGRSETEYTLSIFADGARSYYEVERAERGNGSVTIGVNYRTTDGARGRFLIVQTADGEISYRTDDGEHMDFDD